MDISTYNDDVSHDVISIEGLRKFYGSCFTCGVSWSDQHVSLDCIECGGFAMQRPCPQCEGKCSSIWRRNLLATHENQKASWDGECKILKNNNCYLKNKDSPLKTNRRIIRETVKVV